MLSVEVEIRPATAVSAGRVLGLVRDYLREIQEQGSELLPTPRTLSTYARFIDAFTTGEWPGVVLECDAGFTMAGQPGRDPLFDTNPGPMAYAWGTYVSPDNRRQGIAAALRARLRDELRALGFRAISGAVHRLNAAGIDSLRSLPFNFHQAVGIERL